MEQMQEKLPYIDPYKPEPGTEFLASGIPRNNVARLYQLLKR